MSEFNSNSRKLHLFMSVLNYENTEYTAESINNFFDGYIYKTLRDNCLKASQYNTLNSNKLVEDFNNLCYEISSLKDLYILQTKASYLLSISTPNYYVNPMLDNRSFNFDIHSIGDLKLIYRNEFISFNKLKTAPGSKEEKNEAITKQCVKYHAEAVIKNTKIINRLEETNSMKHYFGLKNIFNILEWIVFLFINIFTTFLICSFNQEIINNFYHPEVSSIYTYVIYLPVCSLILVDVFFTIFHIIKSRIFNEYNFARKFIKTRKSSVYSNLQRSSLQLKKYICECVFTKREFTNDIDFFKDQFEELNIDDAIKIRRKSSNNKIYNVFLIISNSCLIIGLISCIFSLVSSILLGVF